MHCVLQENHIIGICFSERSLRLLFSYLNPFGLICFESLNKSLNQNGTFSHTHDEKYLKRKVKPQNYVLDRKKHHSHFLGNTRERHFIQLYLNIRRSITGTLRTQHLNFYISLFKNNLMSILVLIAWLYTEVSIRKSGDDSVHFTMA